MLFQKNGVLIQWKPTTSEIFRSFTDLSKPDLEETVLKSKPGA
jgi:DNA polymerase-2